MKKKIEIFGKKLTKNEMKKVNGGKRQPDPGCYCVQMPGTPSSLWCFPDYLYVCCPCPGANCPPPINY